jgi:acylphosphatase
VIARRVRVSGRVQGVFFRHSATEQARMRGVAGWVRNCPDGTVEAWFEGAREAVEAVVEWCRRGPRGAQVERIDVEDADPAGLRGFDVR